MRNLFDELDDDKMRVNLSISLYGKTYSLNNVYEDAANWTEVLSDITSVLEASYGYSFNIEHPTNEDINLGIFVPEKD